MGPEQVLRFWLDEVGPDGWYKADDALDQEIRAQFQSTWEGALEGKYSLWLTYPSGALAYIILTDQFSRNMFRGTAKAFSSDRIALAAAKAAVDRRWDMKIDEPARQFFYLPMMHSEILCDQDRGVRLISERLRATGADNLLHARAHREIIRDFGRFPTRNAALGRPDKLSERAFFEAGGYGAVLRRLQPSASAIAAA